MIFIRSFSLEKAPVPASFSSEKAPVPASFCPPDIKSEKTKKEPLPEGAAPL